MMRVATVIVDIIVVIAVHIIILSLFFSLSLSLILGESQSLLNYRLTHAETHRRACGTVVAFPRRT